MIDIKDILDNYDYILAGEDNGNLTDMSRFQKVDLGYFTRKEDAILQFGNELMNMYADAQNPNLKLVCMDMPRLTSKRVFETHVDDMVSIKLYSINAFVVFE